MASRMDHPFVLYEYSSASGEKSPHETFIALPTAGCLNKCWKSASVLFETNNNDDDLAARRTFNQSPRTHRNNSVRSCERNGDTTVMLNGQWKKVLRNGNDDNDAATTLNFKNRSIPWCEKLQTAKMNGYVNGFPGLDIHEHASSSDSENTTNLNCVTDSDSIAALDEFTLSENSKNQSNNHSLSRTSPNDFDANSAYTTENHFPTSEEFSQSDQNEEEQFNQTNLIVNYLPQNMTQEEIHSLFSTIGEVDSCKLIKDKNTHQHLGYGFVNYVHAKHAARAIAQLNGIQLQNKTIKVSLARPSSESIKGANLYISGLPQSMTQEELEKLFSQCGRIITSRILFDSNTGISRGVAFIRFDQRAEAETAIKLLNGHVPSSGAEPLTVKLANTPVSGTVNLRSLVHPNKLLPILPDNFQQINSNTHYVHTFNTMFQSRSTMAMMLLCQLAYRNALMESSSFTGFLHSAQPSVSSNSIHKSLLPHSSSSQNTIRSQRPTHRNFGQGTKCTVSNLLQERCDVAASLSSAASQSLVSHILPNNSRALFPNAQTQQFNWHSRYPLIGRSASTHSQPNGMPINFFTSQVGLPATMPFQHYQTSECVRPDVNYSQSQAINTMLPGVPFTDYLHSFGLGSQNIHPNVLASLTCTAPVISSYPQYNFSPTAQVGACLFVSNLPPDADDGILWRLFGPYGAISSVKVVREAGSNRCKGYGFVNMLDYGDALLAIQQLNNYCIGNRILQVNFKNTTQNIASNEHS